MRVETKYGLEDSSKDCGVLWLGSPDEPKFVAGIRDRCEMELLGGKAFNISRLAREGFQVPDGFCITAEAYDCFVHFNNIRQDERISHRIRESLMPPILTETIRNAYAKQMGSIPCAVRSSSPVEDLKSASFAGQYKSFLNVRDEEALFHAIRECWASLWSQSAVEYRKKMNIENKSIEMAVLVQEMIPATASGVLFTEDQMVIEAVWGLGDILVGGKVIPDQFVVEKEGFNIVERRVSHKTMMSQVGFNRELELAHIPDHLRDVPVLNDDQIHSLCTLGVRVEQLFGCPQDIEWALHNGKFTLLQTRPVTVKQTPTIWSRANIAETQPNYVSYLSRTPDNRPDFLVLGLIPFLECFGIKDIPEDMKLIEYIYGHIYANMSTAYSIVGRIPGFSPAMLDQSLGHVRDEETSKSDLKITEILRLLPAAFKVIRFFLSLVGRAEHVIPHSAELVKGIGCKNLQKTSLEELEDLVWEMYDRNQEVLQVHESAILAIMSLVGILQKILKSVEEEGTENLLFTGLEGMSSYQVGVEMWKLAQSASQLPRTAELILSRRENILEELSQFPEGMKFLEDFSGFMEKFGCRCSEELELSVPRWEENPDFVFSMVMNYLNAESSDPLRAMKEQREKRAEVTRRILRKLSRNPAERFVFKEILERTQKYIIMRENLKTSWATGLYTMRLLYLAIAEKLVQKGILENRDDIFYLKMTEVSDVVKGSLGKEQLEERIEQRRKEKEIYEYLDVPMVIVGKPPPIEELSQAVEEKERLEGIGCSEGVVIGMARVVTDPRECSELKEGEILVAPVTDPGWTPFFVIAGGLVMELGGTLSHGVIIAREYGIPAVVGIKNATKIIRTGQSIRVDGNKGVVYIIE